MTKKREYRILIVDDESSIRESLSEYFRDYNISTETVSNSEDGLALLGKEHFDLLIVDVRLPGANGDQFIAAAYQLHETLKFIIHTGSVHFKVTPELAAMGMTENEIFLKPIFDLDALRIRVMELLSMEPPDE